MLNAARFPRRPRPTPPPRRPVTPFVMGPDDMPPDGATPPVPGVCDACGAGTAVMFRRVVLLTPQGWTVALPWVWELEFCAHHAGRFEAGLRGWGRDGCGPIDVGPWAVVLDLRNLPRYDV